MKSLLSGFILFSTFLSLMAISENRKTRYFYLVILIIIFIFTFFLFSYEYDKEKIKAWKEKEKKLKEEIYLKCLKKRYEK